MKTGSLFLLFVIAATTFGYSQKLVALNAQPPSLPGGFEKYVEENIRLPRKFRKGKAAGEVELSFTVDSTGSVPPNSIRIIGGLCKKCDKEVIRLVKNTPSWTPANRYSDNKKVTMGYRTIIRFEAKKAGG